VKKSLECAGCWRVAAEAGQRTSYKGRPSGRALSRIAMQAVLEYCRRCPEARRHLKVARLLGG
jgi:hypothetical protein